MKRVTENNLTTDSAQLLWHHRFDTTVGTHRHERRRFNYAAPEDQSSAAGNAIVVQPLEFHLGALPRAGQKHGVTIAKKTVTLIDSMRVGGKNILTVSKSAYKHK